MNVDIKNKIQKIIKGDVLDDEKTLVAYSHDASLFEVKPKVVVFPKDSDDIRNLIKYVNENKDKNQTLSLTARSAGTDMSGGPLNESIIIDFTKYMNRLISFGDDLITVEPGMFYRDFEKETLKQDLFLPSYPASKSICAMGGMIGNNAAGEKTLRHGRTGDYIKELEVIFADGNKYTVKPLTKKELVKKIKQEDFEGKVYKEIYQLLTTNYSLIKDAKPHVSKNVAGYTIWDVWDGKTFDLNKLIAGSQGTLGFVTKTTFRLLPVKKASKVVAVFLNDLKSLGPIVNKILEFNPESLEAYDDKTLKLAIRFFPDFLKKKGLWKMIRFMWSFLPEFWMMILGGIPKFILLVEFVGDDKKEMEKKAKILHGVSQSFNVKTHITKSDAEAEKYWEIRRRSFSLLRRHVRGKRTAPFIDDFIIRPDLLSEFLPKLNKILKQYPIEYTIAGHAGDGNFHIIPLMDFNNPNTQKIILELSDKVYGLVLEYDGSITAEHNDGIIRTPYLKKMYGEEMYNIFEKIKNIFDPKNIFNPGKKVGGSREHIKEYLIKPTNITLES